MPLSEHEQRVLEQMEQALSAEDPRFASNMEGTTQARRQRRRAAVGVLAAIVGLGLIVLGVTTQEIWLGGVGFAAMVFGGAWALTPSRRPPQLRVVADNDGKKPGGPTRISKDHPSNGGQRGARPKNSGFMDRLEQRWDKRREDGPF